MNETCYVILQEVYYEGNGDPLFATTSLDFARSYFQSLVNELKNKNENYSTLCLYAVQNDKSVVIETFDFGPWYNNKQLEKWKAQNPGKNPPVHRPWIQVTSAPNLEHKEACYVTVAVPKAGDIDYEAVADEIDEARDRSLVEDWRDERNNEKW